MNVRRSHLEPSSIDFIADVHYTFNALPTEYGTYIYIILSTVMYMYMYITCKGVGKIVYRAVYGAAIKMAALAC